MVLTSVDHCSFRGHLKLFEFLENHCFSTKRVSAQRLSAFFRFLSFFRCTFNNQIFAWRVCLEQTFIETYENFGRPSFFNSSYFFDFTFFYICFVYWFCIFRFFFSKLFLLNLKFFFCEVLLEFPPRKRLRHNCHRE